jgi:predicted house-cleaning noncanonical NTP pyrophosphatase (MazG superfamily)
LWYNINMANKVESKIFSKLVRDKIPEMISKNNQEPEWYIFPEADVENELIIKLGEESGEYLESKNPEELADILEVLRELAKIRGIPFSEIETIRQRKLKERGGFTNRIFLVRVKEK